MTKDEDAPDVDVFQIVFGGNDGDDDDDEERQPRRRPSVRHVFSRRRVRT